MLCVSHCRLARVHSHVMLTHDGEGGMAFFHVFWVLPRANPDLKRKLTATPDREGSSSINQTAVGDTNPRGCHQRA